MARSQILSPMDISRSLTKQFDATAKSQDLKLNLSPSQWLDFATQGKAGELKAAVHDYIQQMAAAKDNLGNEHVQQAHLFLQELAKFSRPIRQALNDLNLHNANVNYQERAADIKRIYQAMLDGKNAAVLEQLEHDITKHLLKAASDENYRKELEGPRKHFEGKIDTAQSSMAGQAMYDPLERIGILLAELHTLFDSSWKRLAGKTKDLLQALEGEDPGVKGFKELNMKRLGIEGAGPGPAAAPTPNMPARPPGMPG